MPVLTTQTDDPWGSAQQVFNKFARIDRQLANQLDSLNLHQAHDNKLAFSIEAGRVYGLQQQFYNMRLKQQLGRQHPHTEEMW
jgi:hypothetical protein